MPDLATLGLFTLAALVLLVTPGPAVLYIVARSLEQGRAAGLVSVLGIHSGTLVHVAAAALGLSAVLASSAFAFALVKYLGAAYLIYLGIRKLVGTDPPGTARSWPERSLGRVFSQGMVVQLLNPKTALFFLAFLPQFVDVGGSGVTSQLLLLGLLFTALGVVSDGAYALAAGAAGEWLRSARILRAERYVAGGVFIGLGLTAALAGDGRK
jgi:threonine/homoserine/homoserine lactone efflux protein